MLPDSDTMLDPFQQALTSLAAAQRDLDAARQNLTHRQAAVEQQLADLARHPALAYDHVDADDLAAFVRKPYTVVAAPHRADTYWLIVPTFLNLRAGWPVRRTDTYTIYELSRFLHFLAPLPDWLAADLAFPPPSYQAVLDHLNLMITDGDAAEVYRKLGGRTMFSRRSGDVLRIRPSKRVEVLRRMLHDEGLLPYAAVPVPTTLRRAPLKRMVDQQPSFVLRPHQQATYDHLMETSAMSLFAPGQTGKSFVVLDVCATVTGSKLIVVPRRAIAEQWRRRSATYLTAEAAAEVQIVTYQALQRTPAMLDGHTLVVFDEAHHLPAAFAIDAALRCTAPIRMALTATPFREDGHEDLIPILGGFPAGVDWPLPDHQRPRILVETLATDAAKLDRACALAAQPISGKTVLFVQRLAVGDQLAAMLNVPFVSSRTPDPLATLLDPAVPTVIASPVADMGISMPGIQRIIEVDFHGASRMQAGQRAARLSHQEDPSLPAGVHYLLMTTDEFRRFHGRLLAYIHAGFDLDIT